MSAPLIVGLDNVISSENGREMGEVCGTDECECEMGAGYAGEMGRIQDRCGIMQSSDWLKFNGREYAREEQGRVESLLVEAHTWFCGSLGIIVSIYRDVKALVVLCFLEYRQLTFAPFYLLRKIVNKTPIKYVNWRNSEISSPWLVTL